MTRLKLIPWLAIPALLLTFGLVLPTANAAAPAENDDVIYLPMGEQQEWLKQGTNSGLKTSVAGEVAISQFGVVDAVIGNTNGMLAVRFDPPFNAPYTITGISFPTRTQFQIPATPGRFISVRVQSLEAGDAGPTSLWSKQRAISCTANNTTTVTRATGSFTANGVQVGDRLDGPKVQANTLVTSVGTSSVTLDKPVPTFVTVNTTSYIPPPRLITCTTDIPGARLVSVTSSFVVPAVVTRLLTRATGSFITDDVRVGDVAVGPSIPANTKVVTVTALTVTVDKDIPVEYLVPTPVTFTTPLTRRLLRSSGSFITDDVRVGDVVTGTNIPAATKVVTVAATVVTVDKDLTVSFTQTVTFTTPFIRVLTRASGSYLLDGVLVGDAVTGPGIPAATKVASVTALTVTMDKDIVTSFTDLLTFTSTQPQVRDFVRPSVRAWLNRVAVSSTGGMNTIPLNIAAAPGQTFFVIFQFPRPPASADTFPFLFTDRNFTDRGLFANSFTTDTNAVIRTAPPTLGTFAGTSLFADQNIMVSMTCQLTGAVPMNSPKNAGLNLRDAQVEWAFGEPDAGVLADGEATNAKTNVVELVKRDLTWGYVSEGGASSGKIQLPAVPGSGMQIWGTRGRANNGTTSQVSNVTISGSATVVGYPGAIVEDADEANGKDSDVEAAAVTPPFAGRPESLWPAGDIDNYTFFAQPGQVISVTATPVGNDFRSDMSLVVNLMENNHDVVESQIGGPGAAVSFLSNAAPPSGGSGSKAFKRYYLQVYDRSGSPDDPANWNRVLIPASYTLDVDVFTPAANLISDDPDLSGLSGGDEFAFANAGRNPSRGPATFSYVIPKSKGEASVRLRIYDVRGRMINTLVNGTKAAGTHFASWSGHDQRGNRVASGPYFARIDAGSFSRTVRIVMN